MAKDLESLAVSRDIRRALISEWGCIPGSIWKVNWQRSSEDITKSYGDQQRDNELEVGSAFRLSGTGARHGALSRFPQDLCRFLVKFYSNEGDTVLDPFAGHNSRMESVYMTGRNYIGFDICKQYMDFNRRRSDEIKQKYDNSLFPTGVSVQLVEVDSRRIGEYVEANSADFCITSPPFWNIEYYGPEPEQLGLLSYTDFLVGMETVASACMDALKPNSYIAWEVNDFRADGKFYSYHRDTMGIFESIGLKMHDIIVVDYGNAFLKSFLSDVDYLKVMPKQHAYIIVAKKEGERVGSRAGHREVLKDMAARRPIGENEQRSFLGQHGPLDTIKPVL